ncbi:MAG: hypothetical protein AB1750_07255 [Chloroflexota bacterium]
MKKYIGLIVLLAFSLSACGELGRVSSAPDPFKITPSRPPRIFTATPNIVVPTKSATPSGSASPTPSLDLPPGSSPTATFTFTPTFTATSTATVSLPLPTITLLGCDTGFDVKHGMGEVTNAYVTVANRFGPNLTNVCATLASADEGRAHPDKTVCAPSLPMGYQVTFKLTIDTTYSVNTVVDVSLTTNEGISTRAGGLACRDIGSFKPADNTLGVIVPIP